MSELTNADRAERARQAFAASPHFVENNDDLTNLYDLVCDLGHLADALAREDPSLLDDTPGFDTTDPTRETLGAYVHRLGAWHYSEELAEEAADECEGHPAGPSDPMGETTYCDGTCRAEHAGPIPPVNDDHPDNDTGDEAA